jgi:dolichol-phosphate mannosyltransferase
LIIIAIPAYNEEDNIGPLLERIAGLGYNPTEYHVLVVNDGSTDNTMNVVQSFQNRMPVTLLGHETNYGVGQVFRTIFTAVLDMAGPGDIVVTIEADNTSDLAILEEMIRQVKLGNDLVLASCYAEGGGAEGSNLYRIVLSGVANLLLRFFYPIGVRTYSSFYRAYRTEILRAANAVYGGKLIEEEGFVCMVEVLVKLSRLPLRIVEVPMVLKTDARQGNSKMKVVRTIQGYLRFIARDLLLRKQPMLPSTIACLEAPGRLEG